MTSSNVFPSGPRGQNVAQDDVKPIESFAHDEMKPSTEGAQHAQDQEKTMSLRQAIKLYPKAIGWSVVLSTALVMEGYDLALLNNLYAHPEFNKKFGVLGSNGDYAVPASWQSGLSNGARCGEMLGLAINGIISERYGFVPCGTSQRPGY